MKNKFPANKYKKVSGFLRSAMYYNNIKGKDGKYYRMPICNKDIHLDDGTILYLNTHNNVVCFTKSIYDLHVYDINKLGEMTPENFYSLYHTLQKSIDSIIFQLTL